MIPINGKIQTTTIPTTIPTIMAAMGDDSGGGGGVEIVGEEEGNDEEVAEVVNGIRRVWYTGGEMEVGVSMGDCMKLDCGHAPSTVMVLPPTLGEGEMVLPPTLGEGETVV